MENETQIRILFFIVKSIIILIEIINNNDENSDWYDQNLLIRLFSTRNFSQFTYGKYFDDSTKLFSDLY